jgi:bifunctional UDP-N-acetylglucosamine pyrophosphorylase/glucosamine-1-phosphate N-acetyltransferase
MDVLILAAGRGTRMGELTRDCPKPLLEVAGRPLLGHLLARLAPLGAERTVVVTHYLGERIRGWLARRHPDVIVVDQGVADGTARAVACAEPVLGGGPVLVVSGDNLYATADLRRLAVEDGFHHIGVVGTDRPQEYGVIRYGDAGRGLVAGIIEKPAQWPAGQPAEINAGAYLFLPEIFPVLQGLLEAGAAAWEEEGREIPLTDGLSELARRGRLRAVRLEYWQDMGHPEDLVALDRLLREEGSDGGE